MRPNCFLTRILSITAVAACLVYPAGSQSSISDAQTKDLVLKKTVRRVIVDVVVTDSTSRPVPGLTEKDFTVKEDGRSQQALSFDVHTLDSGVDSIPKVPDLPTNTFLNLPPRAERGPLYVLLYDMVNMEVEDQPRARQQILKFIRGKPAGTRFAIFVISDVLRMVQGFTDDENLLYAALDPSSPKPHVPKIFLYGRNHGLGDPFFTMSVFSDIAHYLEGLPGRKNLIWFSSRFPVRLFPREGDSPDMRDDAVEVISAMTRSQTAVYTVDAGGVNPENPHGPGPQAEMGRIANTASSGGAVDPGAGESLIMANQTAERDIAVQTGGKAFVGTNDLEASFADATAMGGNYYSLSYSPSNQNYDGKLRKIQVELAKRGYQLAYRRSYYADDPELPSPHVKKTSASEEDPATRKQGDSLSANMQHGAPLAHQLLFKAHLYTVSAPALGTPEQMANIADQPGYFSARHKNKQAKPLAPIQLQSYTIDYTIIVRQLNPASANGRPNLEIAAAAYDEDGKMVNGVVEKAVKISFSNPFGSLQTAPPPEWEPSQNGFYRAQQHLVVPLNAKTLRLAVRDLDSDRIGAMEVSLPLTPEAPPANAPAVTTIPTTASPN
jgi:VWFA-related protein